MPAEFQNKSTTPPVAQPKFIQYPYTKLMCPYEQSQDSVPTYSITVNVQIKTRNFDNQILLTVNSLFQDLGATSHAPRVTKHILTEPGK